MQTSELLKQATARPWIVGTKHHGRVMTADKKRPVALTSPQDEGTETEEEKANAELIARAANAFEPMREALREYMDRQESEGNPSGLPEYEQAKAALAIAEGNHHA